MYRRFALVVAVVILAGASFGPRPVSAQTEGLCFDVTAVTNCIWGRFREYWEQNGGLQVFGYPTTPAQYETNPDSDVTYLTQWFERNRLEYFPEHARPYDVLLGRLGVEALERQGRDWTTFPKADPSAPNYFRETGHAIAYGPFWDYWSKHGLEFDGQPGFSTSESLALFGLPISEPQMETNPNGDTVITQWFERARFEDHGDQGVLLGLLGSEVHGAPSPAVPIPPTPPTPPEPTPPPINVPVPQGICADNAPAPAEAGQSWMTIREPSPGVVTTVCVRLILGGRAVQNAVVTGKIHYPTADQSLTPTVTGYDGVAAIPVLVSNLGLGQTIPVDVFISYQGQTFRTLTSFTPR